MNDDGIAVSCGLANASTNKGRSAQRLVAISAFAVVLIAILAVTWWVYHPGLSGAFLFDDLGSLPKLGATGPVDNWATFWRYITSGTADPTGRPVAMLSFLIDARNWPANPYPFKVTNVILHLINGALLAWVLWKLGRVLASRNRAQAQGIPPRLRRSPLRSVGGGKPPPSAGRGIEGDGFSPSATSQQIASSPRAFGATPFANEGGEDLRGVAIAALFGSGAWLLHPLLVSTTLYVVQREAMLAATFVLIGMLGWIASREALTRGHIKRAYLGMVLSAWLCTLLAVLSKANGALLPVLLLLIEWIVLAPRLSAPSPEASRRYRRAMGVFLILPCLLLAAYLLYILPGSVRSAPGIRGWSVGQRLLTEPRVLTDYLRLLFAPHAHSTGLFNDQFTVPTGWLHPVSTLPCTVFIVALIGVGFALRKRHPAIALALLFYFAAQLLESGWIPLELYFEHRNYMPAMLLFWPIGIGLGRAGALRHLRAALAVAALLLLASLTGQRATLWGNAFHQAQIWAAMNPDSARAQTSAALYDLQNDRPRLAAARLQLALRKHPDSLQIPVNLVTAECRLGTVRPETLEAARAALANDRVGGEVAFNWFDDALASVKQHACSGLTLADLQGLLNAAGSNPHWRDREGMRVDRFHLQGLLELAQHRPQEALEDFDLALKQTRQPATALNQAATLASSGYPQLGLAHLDYLRTLPKPDATGFGMPRIHAWVLQRQGYWQNEISHLRKAMQTASSTQAPSP